MLQDVHNVFSILKHIFFCAKSRGFTFKEV